MSAIRLVIGVLAGYELHIPECEVLYAQFRRLIGDLGYRAASEHFIECIRDGRDPEVTVHDGLAALEVSLALRASAHAESNRVV